MARQLSEEYTVRNFLEPDKAVFVKSRCLEQKSKSDYHFSQISCNNTTEMKGSKNGLWHSKFHSHERDGDDRLGIGSWSEMRRRGAAEMMEFTANADQAPLTSQTELLSSAERNV
jgi:hypothetical protein